MVAYDEVVEEDFDMSVDIAPPKDAKYTPVRKEFPETWLWQSIASKRLGLSTFFFAFCMNLLDIYSKWTLLV